MANKTIKSWNT